MAGMQKGAAIDGWDAHMKEHFDGITLTDDQKTQIVASHKQHQGMIAKLKEGGTMDEKTINEYRQFGGAEPRQYSRVFEPTELNSDERRVLEGLYADRWGTQFRLEQERLPWEHCMHALRTTIRS